MLVTGHVHDPSAAARAARLRGRLAENGVGARELEHLARNPDCRLLAAATLARVSMISIFSEVFIDIVPGGIETRMSPFPRGRGVQFERLLTEGGGARLVQLYRSTGRIGADDVGWVDVSDGPKTPALRRRRTQELLRRKLADTHTAPAFVVQPYLTLPVAGIAWPIRPDLLQAAPGDSMFRPVEIKSFAHRAGLTEPSRIEGAARQAAVEVAALRSSLCELGVGVDEAQALVPARADFVFANRWSLRKAVLESLDLSGEVAEIEALVARAPRLLAEAEALIAQAGSVSLDTPAAARHLPIRFSQRCLDFCAGAPACAQWARQAGDPAVLGEALRDVLAPAGTVWRALALLDGAAPVDSSEAALQRSLLELEAIYERVLQAPVARSA